MFLILPIRYLEIGTESSKSCQHDVTEDFGLKECKDWVIVMRLTLGF